MYLLNEGNTINKIKNIKGMSTKLIGMLDVLTKEAMILIIDKI